MAYELSWQFDTNRVYLNTVDGTALAKHQAWYLVTFLLGNTGGATGPGLWSYVGSSNATLTDMSSNVANSKITLTSFVLADWTFATSAISAACSWVVLSHIMPNGRTMYLIIGGGSISATNSFGIWYANTTVSLASTPTFLPVSATRTPNTNLTGLATNDNTTGQHMFNGCLANNGQFIVFDVKTGTSNTKAGNIVIWAPTIGYSASDAFPWYAYHGFNASYGFANLTVLGSANPTSFTSAARGGTGADGWFNAIIGAPSTGPGLWGGAAKKDFLTQAVWDLPFLVMTTDLTNYLHARGRVQDLAWTLSDQNNAPMAQPGSVIKEAGVIKYIVLDNLIIPFNTVLSM